MHCKEFQRRKPIPQKPPGHLMPMPAVEAPVHRVGVDLLGRFPKSFRGTLEAQQKDHRIYDAKHRPVNCNPGDLLWIFKPVRKVGLSEKLLKKYFGPYQVVRKLSEVTYEGQDFDPLTKRRKIKDIVHVVRMKPYYDPDMQKDCSEDSPKIIQDTNPSRAEPKSTSQEKRMTYTGPTTRSRAKLAS
ncbi:hypothetical protein AVEN_219962-1 [Araneus ventricosus]|uniref:Integrase p58-like C-terminal domain-containing protein n=1 Tax=Araneus ventricosus TaxID=182803 RepID=A0A4Y2NGE9_ARAVE|nr:hypothetical protein AVEN_219962-1 [Araneus ventricosus]